MMMMMIKPLAALQTPASPMRIKYNQLDHRQQQQQSCGKSSSSLQSFSLSTSLRLLTRRWPPPLRLLFEVFILQKSKRRSCIEFAAGILKRGRGRKDARLLHQQPAHSRVQAQAKMKKRNSFSCLVLYDKQIERIVRKNKSWPDTSPGRGLCVGALQCKEERNSQCLVAILQGFFRL